MPLSVQNIRNETRTILGVDIDDYDDTQVDLWANMAWWELQDKVAFREKQATFSFSTAVGIAEYTIPAVLVADFENTEHVTILQYTAGDYEPLTYKDYNNLMDMQSLAVDSRGLPEYYARFGTQIHFHPVPDLAYTVKVRYRKTLADLVGGGTVDIPQSWHEFIILGAAFRGFRAMGNYTRASNLRAERDSMIVTAIETESKEQIDYGMAGVQVLRRRYP